MSVRDALTYSSDQLPPQYVINYLQSIRIFSQDNIFTREVFEAKAAHVVELETANWDAICQKAGVNTTTGITHPIANRINRIFRETSELEDSERIPQEELDRKTDKIDFHDPNSSKTFGDLYKNVPTDGYTRDLIEEGVVNENTSIPATREEANTLWKEYNKKLKKTYPEKFEKYEEIVDPWAEDTSPNNLDNFSDRLNRLRNTWNNNILNKLPTKRELQLMYINLPPEFQDLVKLGLLSVQHADWLYIESNSRNLGNKVLTLLRKNHPKFHKITNKSNLLDFLKVRDAERTMAKANFFIDN